MTDTDSKKPFVKKTWFLLLCGTIVFMAALLVLLPLAAKYYLSRWLIENGADQAVIERVQLNPFSGKVGLLGVTVQYGGATVLSNADIQVDVAMLKLFKKQAVIQRSVLEGVTLDIEFYKDGRIRFGSYTIHPASPNAAKDTAPQDVLWIFSANRIEISDCTVRFTMPNLHLNLHVSKASLTKFTTAPGDKSGAFVLTGSINGTPVALDLQTVRITPDIIARGSVKVDGFALNNLDAFLRSYLKSFAGKATIDGTTMFKMAEGGDIFVDYEGMLGIEGGHIAGNSFSVKGAPIRWEKGKIQFAMTEKSGIKVDVDGRLTGKSIFVDIPDPIIKIHGPDIDINGKVLVTIDDEVKVDANAGFQVKKITFSMPPLAAEAGNLSWKGKNQRIQFNSGTGKKPLSVKLQGNLLGDHPLFNDQDKHILLATRGDSISWNGGVSYQMGSRQGTSSQINTRGQLTVKNIHLSQADSIKYAQQSLISNGRIDLSLGSNDALRLNLDNTIAGKNLSVDLPGAKLAINQKSIEITDKGSISLNSKIAVKGTASVKTNGLTIKQTGRESFLASLQQFTMDSIEAPGGRSLNIQKAKAGGLAVHIPGSIPLAISIPEILLSDLQSTDLSTYGVARVTALSPTVTSEQNGKNLAGLNNLEIRHITAGANSRISVDRINFDDLYFLEKSKNDREDICTIGGARLSKIDWNPETGLMGDSLSFADLYCTLVREKDGGLVVGKRLADMRNPDWKPDKTEEKRDTNSPASTLSLGQVTLRGKSGLHFEDHTLEVPFVSNLDITTLQLKGLDSRNPEKPASIRMTGSMEKRAPLAINGTIAPFLKELGLQLKIRLKNYPLSHLSPYTVQSVGVALASGSLRLTSDISLKNRRLDMKNKVLLKQLKTSTISKELADKLDNQLPIPLESALSMLKDRNDTISLDVPLSGPIDKISVGISDILITALGKAIVPAASGYLVYALGPYGALAWVGMEVGSRILEVRLPPVQFKPNDDQLPDNSEDYFKRLAKILQDKPDVDFRLCPKSSSWELSADKQEERSKKESVKQMHLNDEERKRLMELGQKRARNIKQCLVEKYGCDKDRLLICITRIEEKKSAKPRVDIQM